MNFTTTARLARLVLRNSREGYVKSRGLLPVLHRYPAPIVAYHTSPVRLGTTLYIDHELAAAAQDEAKTIHYPLRHVKFTTCRTPINKNTTTKGLTFNAAYIDTHPGANASMPTVVTLHGSPGSHLDFKHMIEFLPKQNMRVISLNFPGFNWTPMDRNNEFGHTTLEKTAFLSDFLEAIKISKIDVMVVHSAGTYPAMRLCANTDLIQSLLLVNPVGHRYMKSFSPWWFFENHARFSRTPILQTLLLIVLKLRLMLVDSPNKDALQMSAAIETLAKFDYDQQQNAITKLARKKFPVAVMYSENDTAVEAEISNELAIKLGGSQDLMQHYNADTNIVNFIPKKGDRIFRGYVFEKGGHFLTKRHPEIVNQAILELYHDVHK